MAVLEREPIVASENERPALNKIEGVLGNVHRAPKLVGPYGEEIELPQSLFHVLRQLVHHLLQGRAVTVVPHNKELTTQEAADIIKITDEISQELRENILGER